MHRPTVPALSPLVVALAAAFPLHGVAAPPVIARPAAPAANAVPVPTAGWRVFGSGAAAPVNTPNAAGGIDQRIDQTSNRAIYNWQSFDIGAASSVRFAMPDATSSALNRVQNSTAPSRIFGRLESNGQVFLINTNGILFGKGARVDVGALVASTLNLSDSDFLSGMTDSILSTRPTFAWDGDPLAFTDTLNFVRVDAGAEIATASGGRVFLFAKNVQNDGAISTPGGQAVLGAGREVYLNSPSNEVLYASEVNPAIPALRGLLVEVGGTAGTVSNGGFVSVPRGNATLVGMAVNQTGRISATTSVSENGSVFLLARGGAQSFDDGTVRKRATEGGTLTLGAGSRVEITPDTALGSDGKTPTADGNSSFTASRVELSGRTVELQAGAAIVAPGGVVRARAEGLPNYEPDAVAKGEFGTPDDARLVVGQGSVIDVSGTTGTSVSVARHFVATELLGASDLKDAPLQKDGPLYRSKVTFDLRPGAPMLGDLTSYQKGIRRSADELLSGGGSVALASTGAVVTHADSALNVSGGRVTYTEAVVTPTVLVAQDGSRVTLDKASRDTVYTAIEGKGSGAADRWGLIPQFGSALGGRLEAGYVAGAAGGSLQVVGRTVVLDGQVSASTIVGARQAIGRDALPGSGAIQVGSASAEAIVDRFTIGAARADLGAVFWADPLAAALPGSGRIAAATLEASGARRIGVATGGDLVVEPGADLALTQRATVALQSRGDLALGASVRSSGGTVSAQAFGADSTLTLGAGATIDTSGTWVNVLRDGAVQAPALAGGAVTLRSTHGLQLADGSVIDVAGGGTVAASGAITGTAGGAVSIAANTGYLGIGDPAALRLGSTLHGESIASGGRLSLQTTQIDLVAGGALGDGALAPGALLLGTGFFGAGGFASYDLGGTLGLTVHAGATIAPRARNWVPTAAARTLASGSDPAAAMTMQTLRDGQRKPVNLTLSSSGINGDVPRGDLRIEQGAVIDADPKASVTLNAGHTLVVDGAVRASGGNVALNLASSFTGLPEQGFAGLLRVGETGVLDVSGSTQLVPDLAGLRRGQVLGGGNLSLAVDGKARRSPIEIAPGASLRADGASGTLDVDTRTSFGIVTAPQEIASDGGSIAIAAREGGALLRGQLSALAGGRPAAAGRFSLDLRGRSRSDTPLAGDVGAFVVRVQGGTDTAAVATPGAVVVSANTLQRNFADATLASMDRLDIAAGTRLAMARSLELDAPVLAVDGSRGAVTVSAASTLRVGNAHDRNATGPVPEASGGTAALVLQSGLVELFGEQSLRHVGSVQVRAGSEMRVDGVLQDGVHGGALHAQADVSITTPQLSPTSGTRYVLDAGQGAVTIGGGDANAAAPLSANAALTIRARTITQDGVLRAPFGQLTLDAPDGVTLGAGSVTSVSGAGLTVPFGTTSAGRSWQFDGEAVDALVDKGVTLTASAGKVEVAKGATVDVSGGGSVVALEFVAGPGGSKDIFAGAAGGAYAIVPGLSGHAPQDAAILAQADANGAKASAALARQITIGAGGPLPAGTYTLLPARYAVLPGAYLVQPAGSTAVALGFREQRANGSVLVGAQFGTRGTAIRDATTVGVVLTPSAIARKSSEIRETVADTVFADAGTARPRDAGRIALAGRDLGLAGTLAFGTQAGDAARGELALAAERLAVVGPAQTAPAGAVRLDADALSATGAGRILVGGRAAADGAVTVVAREVTLDNAGHALRAPDVTLVATEAVTVRAGAGITATGSSRASAETLQVAGDGALLRVAASEDATTVRTGTLGAAGALVVDSGAELRGGRITAEATFGTELRPGATVAADAVTLGASRIAVGDAAASAPGTLVLTPALAGTLGTGDLTLRGLQYITVEGQATLGGAAQTALTLDTGLLAFGSGAGASLTAGRVTLQNTTGAEGAARTGDGMFTVAATNGPITLGPGRVALAGVQSTTLNAAGSLVLDGTTVLATTGSVALTAASVTATDSASARLETGRFAFAPQSGGTAAAAGFGAHLDIAASSVELGGRIELPSGEVSIAAAGAAGDRRAFVVRAGAQLDVAGRDVALGAATAHTDGGSLSLRTEQGFLVVDRGATLDVSAAPGGGNAGTLAVAAPTGALTLGGSLLGRAADGGDGGRLVLDSSAPVNLAALAGTLAAGATATQANFAGELDIRNRAGNQVLAAGTTLGAQRIVLESDAGTLAVAGTLDASGARGGRIELSSGRDLTVRSGAQLLARGEDAGRDGGRITIASTIGTVTLAEGATLDTSSADGKAEGRVQLRARQTDTGVLVAPIASTLRGGGDVEVDAVKVYVATTLDKALATTIAGDAATFAGSDGARAATIKADIAGGNPDLAARLHLRSDAEVRSRGDLAVQGDAARGGWNLTRFNADGSMATRAGDEPYDVTLRAGGDLIVGASISDGFKTGGATTANNATNIRAGAVVLPGDAASIRLVGGADLTAASVLRTNVTSGGSVRIGNGGNVFVRTTTGDIDIAAARDVVLTDPGAVVYTTGRPTADLPAGFVGPTLANAYVRDGALRQGLFLDGGGSIGITAGGNVDFGGRASAQYGVDWWWRAARNNNVSWYARYDRFQQGVAALGGGDVRVRAGGDAINVSASAPDSGFLPSADTAATGAQPRRYGGGSVALEAGGDVVGGFVFAGGAQARVRAGGSVRANGDGDALQVLTQATDVSIAGRNGATVGKVAQAGLATPVAQFQADPPALYLTGLATGARLDLHADAGDVDLKGLRPSTAPAAVAQTSTENGEAVLPDRVAITAPNGSLLTGAIVQLPAGASSLTLAARDDTTVGTLRVAGTTAAMTTPTTLSQLDVNALTLGVFDGGRTPLDTSAARDPVRLAARDGDLRLAGGLESVKPLQASAGRDIVVDNPVTVQHQAGTEWSSVVAGRDILLPTSFKASGFDLRVLGPGDVVVSAGRDIDFSQSGGIGASGNRDNRLLPAGSARLTVLAGVSLAGADGPAASLRFFPLLGGGGIADFAPDLAAQLEALTAGQALPAFGSAAASAFKALPVDEQLARVKALAGDAAWDAALLAFMRQRETVAFADVAEVRAAFASLNDAERAPLAARLLARLWSERVTPAAQREQALAMAASLGSASGAAALADFVAQRTGQRPADAAAALAAFDALPAGERLLFNTQRLAQALRDSGRAASSLAGAARDAAYARGYAALDAVFPASSGRGSIRMGTSQVKTLQGGSVAVLAPRGAIDVGELVGGAKGASELGIVTADGGDVTVVAERDIAVNQSRVFTVGQGDLLMWSSLGNIDAGRGAKTVSGAPAPVFRLNAQGVVVVDTSGSFSGSGIAVLNDQSTLDLYAPRGEINAGDAGIQSKGNAFFGAVRFVGADNLAVGGVSVGAPPPVSVGGATAGLASLGQSTTSAGNRPSADDSEEEKERKRRRRLSLMLDFLGFGEPNNKP